MEATIPTEVLNIMSKMRRILEMYHDLTAKSVSPHSLIDLVGELRPKGIYVTGREKRWYEYVEDGQGLHGEVLQLMSQTDCDELARLELELSEQLSPVMESRGVGARIHSITAVSLSEKRRQELEEQLLSSLESVKHLIADIEANTHGYVDRSRGTAAFRPLKWQILAAYDLSNALVRLERELSQVLSFPEDVGKTLLPLEVDPRLKAVGVDSVQIYLREAIGKLLRNEYPECCHEARKALEECVVLLANLVKGPTKRNFKDALMILKDSLHIPEDTILTVSAKDVGLYGWLSIKGGHAESTVKGEVAKSPFEGRLAIGWVHSVIAMLLDAYMLERSSRNSAR